MRRGWYTYLLIALLVVPVVAVYAYQDDLTIVFNSWASGEPKIMIKLEIHIPAIKAEFCGVVVRRIPTMYRPTKTGFSEEVYVGNHRPGEIVVVKQLLTAIIAKTKIEGGEYKIEYYEPAEYLTTIICKNKETTHKYSKIHEILPNKLITTHKIEVNFEEKTSREFLGSEVSSSTTPISCNLYRISLPGALDAAECVTWVRGPYLYSLPGLKTAFGVSGAYPRSAVYLESYVDSVLCTPQCERDTPQEWSSAGKKLTPSVVSHETAELSGRWKDRVYFNVVYRYEEWYVSFDGFAGIGMLQWLLYPLQITGLERSEALPEVPYEKKYLSFIPPAPSYARGRLVGDTTIFFTPVEQSDTVIASISISFGYVLEGWSAILTVGFYKAGRNDQMYITPYVSVKDVSGNTQAWYYWWYSYNDPMTYETQFSNYR
ncbi:MAG: hypothetical protein QXM79_02455 [Zestosphaera sp.]